MALAIERLRPRRAANLRRPRRLVFWHVTAAFANALVLTIFEAKGLEFDDVFIFDFFEDSPADERTWRVVTGCDGSGTAAAGGSGGGDATDEEAAWAAQIGGAPRAEAFDRQRHALLNEELKMLYTAVTRARVTAV